jgi:hypothetical protein
VSRFKYLGTTVTNKNVIQDEINRGMNSGNACYHSVQNLLSSCLLSKNLRKLTVFLCLVSGTCTPNLSAFSVTSSIMMQKRRSCRSGLMDVVVYGVAVNSCFAVFIVVARRVLLV